MKRLTFDHEHSYTSHRVTLPVRLIAPTGSRLIVTMLDTGAGISVFDNDLISILEIPNIDSGERIELVVASGETHTAYVHQVEVVLLGQQLSIPVAFCPSWPSGTQNLLGMRGFLDQLVIGLDHAARQLLVSFRR